MPDEQHQPRRDDAVATWLKALRDRCPRKAEAWHVLNDTLDSYLDHAETGTPLAAVLTTAKRSPTMYCPDPYNEIVPGLHVGGHDYQPNPDSPWPLDAIIGDEFDLVISLYQRPGHGPADGVEHLYLRIPDAELTAENLVDIRALADRAAEAVTAGKRVLTRCQAGINRSSLVAAFTLLRLGHGPDDAIALIRAKRSPHALYNWHFQAYVAAEGAQLATDIRATEAT